LTPAAPGTRSHDLGYAAWLWLDLGNTVYSAPEQLRRLRLFLDAYGPPPDAGEVMEAATLRQSILIAEATRIGNSKMREWAMQCREWTRQNLTPIVARDPRV